MPFAHPLCVLFSSGTTGRPKAIVHGHGGILLEHLKNHSLSWDLRPGDRILWFSTTAWMMWNALVSGLLVGAGVVLIDGNPVHPDPGWQWRLAEETGATLMGASPGWLMACRAAGIEPTREHDLSRIRQIGAAGSPLPAEGYRWVAERFPDVLLNVGSGGTDVCSGIVQGGPWQPAVEGEIAGPALGVAAAAFDMDGKPVIGELGELVITEPMPSMPVGFWGDPDGTRYRDTYFDAYPGVWRHGDWVRFSESGSVIVAGRSDATLNRGGVRLGTAEFYAVVEELPEVTDSLVVHLEDPAGGNGDLVLFVVPAARRRAGRRPARPDRPRAAHGAVAAARAGPDRRGARGSAEPHRQEAGAAGQADPARRRARGRREPRRARRPDVPRCVRGARPMIKTVAVVGTGVIGASWAALFLAHGLDVVATDPAPGAEERLRADVAATGIAAPDRLTFVADVAEAVADADFVQENGPEREDVKHAVFAALDAAARPDVVLASSSSGMLPSAIAKACTAAPGAGARRAPVQPAAPAAAGGGRAGGEDRRSGRRSGDGLLHRAREEADPAAPRAARSRRQPAAGRPVA